MCFREGLAGFRATSCGHSLTYGLDVCKVFVMVMHFMLVTELSVVCMMVCEVELGNVVSDE